MSTKLKFFLRVQTTKDSLYFCKALSLQRNEFMKHGPGDISGKVRGAKENVFFLNKKLQKHLLDSSTLTFSGKAYEVQEQKKIFGRTETIS